MRYSRDEEICYEKKANRRKLQQGRLVMSQQKPICVHVITGGFPPGSPAGHDMDYARLQLLQLLHERPNVLTTVSNDFTDLAKWLSGSQLLITAIDPQSTSRTRHLHLLNGLVHCSNDIDEHDPLFWLSPD